MYYIHIRTVPLVSLPTSGEEGETRLRPDNIIDTAAASHFLRNQLQPGTSFGRQERTWIAYQINEPLVASPCFGGSPNGSLPFAVHCSRGVDKMSRRHGFHVFLSRILRFRLAAFTWMRQYTLQKKAVRLHSRTTLGEPINATHGGSSANYGLDQQNALRVWTLSNAKLHACIA